MFMVVPWVSETALATKGNEEMRLDTNAGTSSVASEVPT